MDSRLALSIKPQVLTMAMSAMAASSTGTKPPSRREAISTSPSTWFFGAAQADHSNLVCHLYSLLIL